MIKRIYLSIILIVMALCVKSQTSRFEVGIHSGINKGSLYGSGTNYYFNNQYKKRFIGGVGGLDFSYRLSDRNSIKTMLQFEQNAVILHDFPLRSIRSGGVYGQGDEIVKLSYLNVPITFNRSFGKKIIMNVNGGVFIGYLLREAEITIVKQRFQPPGQPPTNETFKKKTNYYNSINFGISFGAGLSLPVSNKIKLVLNIQECLGLYEVNRDRYTNSLSFTTGVLFRM